MFIPTNLGAIKSKKDYRSDVVASAMASAVPLNPTPDLPQSLGIDFFQKNGILMQTFTPSCVSHSVTEIMKLWYFLKTGKIIDFCPRYLHIKSVFPGATPDDGRDPQTVLRVAKSIGCCTTATLPNNTNLPNSQYCDPSVITPVMDAEAAIYKIPGFIPVALSQEGFRHAIKTYGAITIQFEIGQEFWTRPDGVTSWLQKDIDPVRPPAVIISGHELTGIGWNGDLEHLLNHWSKEWAQNGESDWLWNEWEQFIVEAWAIADVPSSVLSTIQGLPAPHEFVHTFSQTLKRGMQGPEVRALQIALSINGEATYPEINGIFGPLTQQAVMLFQQKYASDILTPQGLTLPTGLVGTGTIKKLNSLFGN
jgi:hypothetical protein